MLDMSPAVLFSAFLIGLVGMAMFVFGKKNEDPTVLFAGIGLSIIPMFIHTVWALWLISAGIIAGVYFLKRGVDSVVG